MLYLLSRKKKLRLFKPKTSNNSLSARDIVCFVMNGAIENKDDEKQTCDQLNSNEQITISHGDTGNAAESSVPLTEKVAFIMESGEGLQNLNTVLQTVPSTDENLTNLHDTVESETKAEVGLTSTRGDVGSLTAIETTTTNITLYEKNLQRKSILLLHQKSARVNIDVEQCENVVAGDSAEVNLCCNICQDTKAKSTSSRSNKSDSPVQTDEGSKNSVFSSRKQRKKSDKNYVSRGNCSRKKIKKEWQFQMCLSDFTDSERLEEAIDQWLKLLKPSFLSEVQDDVDDFEIVTETLKENRRPVESSIPNRIEKLDEAICMALKMVQEMEKEKYQTLKIEVHFALAEFYINEDYLKALTCLRALERDFHYKPSLRKGFENQKGRLYAKMAKVMELCLEFSKDFTDNQNDPEIATKALFTDQNPDDVVLSYFQKALESGNNEALLQISCYLGKTSVLLKCCKEKNETRNLTQVRENLRSVEILFSHISPALKCQFYLAEAFLLYYEGRYKMAKYKLDSLMAREIMMDNDEHLMERLERECLGSKRFRFLTEELMVPNLIPHLCFTLVVAIFIIILSICLCIHIFLILGSCSAHMIYQHLTKVLFHVVYLFL